jgi:hypothetical protein
MKSVKHRASFRRRNEVSGLEQRRGLSLEREGGAGMEKQAWVWMMNAFRVG